MIFEQQQKQLLTADDFRPNPYPIYAELLAKDSFSQIEGMLPNLKWSHAVTRYDDVLSLLRDPRLSNDVSNANSWLNIKSAPWVPKAYRSLLNSMLITDAPDHTRLRKLVSKAFTPRMIQGLSGRIADITNQLLDDMDTRDSVDLMNDFALPLPLIVISEMMGVPEEDIDVFHKCSVAFIDDLPNTLGSVVRQTPNFWTLQRFFEKLLKHKRLEPGDDLTTALIAAEDDGDRFSDDEMVGMLFLLLMAGHETTVNLIGNGVLALLEHPEQLAKFQAHPDLLDPMIEEILRYTNPVQHLAPRIAKETIEINGNVINKGESIILVIAAANRDGRVFENPNTFDIARKPNKHLGFGFGAHYCLGAPLARLEAQIAFPLLFGRYPDIQLAIPPSQISRRESTVTSGLTHLPLQLCEPQKVF